MIQRTLQFIVIYALINLFLSSKLISNAHSVNRIKPTYPFEGKVIGGVFVGIKKFPHAVFLLTKCGIRHTLCGSTVVNQKVLITAAHCLSNCNQKSIEAYAGHENLDQVNVLRKVSKSVAHKDFDKCELTNDIGLVLLLQALPLGDNIKRVIIKREYTTKETAAIAGWGLINDVTQERSRSLKSLQQPLFSSSECSAIIGDLHDGVLCAGSVKAFDQRPTRGDSGSGLVTSEYQQIGIVSFRNDANPGLIAYTNVSYYYDWICKTTKKLYCADHYY